MTSPTLANGNSGQQRRVAGRRRGGFTLVEILVVIGIILVLAGLLLPAVTSAYKRAQRAAMFNDLQAIGTALEAYKRDHHDYPRVRSDAALTAATDRPNPMTGAQMLCYALIGPAQKTEVGVTATQRPKQDGQDGPGFRVLRLPGADGAMNTADDDLSAKPAYPPYLSDTFRYGDPMDPANPSQVSRDQAFVLRFTLLDRNDKPILYFPTATARRNVNVAAAPAPYVDSAIAASLAVGATETSRYDGDDNLMWFGDDPKAYVTTPITAGADANLALKRMRVLLGDLMNATDTFGASSTTPDGIVQKDEQPVDLPYLIWGAGPDERFGPAEGGFAAGSTAPEVAQSDRTIINKCDDVGNFRQ